MNARVSMFALVFGLSSAVACGGDEGMVPGPQNTGGFGTTSGVGAATSGVGAAAAGTGVAAAGTGVVAAGTGVAAAGTGAAAAGTGAAGMDVPMAIMCGPSTCEPAIAIPAFGPNAPVPCCADKAMGTCGSMVMGTCVPRPPEAVNCPVIAFSMARRCCVMATNTCGVDATAYGMGCLDVTANVSVPKTTCDGKMVGGGAAGGGAAAGASGAAAGASGGAAGAAAGASGGAAGAAAGASGGAAGSSGRGA